MKRSVSVMKNNSENRLPDSKRVRTKVTTQGETNFEVNEKADGNVVEKRKVVRAVSKKPNDHSHDAVKTRSNGKNISSQLSSTSSGSKVISSKSQCMSTISWKNTSTDQSEASNSTPQSSTNGSFKANKMGTEKSTSKGPLNDKNRFTSTNVNTQSHVYQPTTHFDSLIMSQSSNREENDMIGTQQSTTHSSCNEDNRASYRLPMREISNGNLINVNAMDSLIEGSLQFREMKRLYINEKRQCEEWRKDYHILKRQLLDLRASSIPRPTADVTAWLEELFNLMNGNGMFKGDGRSLQQIADALGLDHMTSMAVAARTPQKSALKLFRILYPTTSSRAKCRSILNVPEEQLLNIYNYVRNLHKNLNFSMSDMRRAIGTSIRSSRCELRRSLQSTVNRNDADDEKGVDSDAIIERLDESIQAVNDTIDGFDRQSSHNDSDKDDDENGGDEGASLTNDEDNDEKLFIDDDVDEADDDE